MNTVVLTGEVLDVRDSSGSYVDSHYEVVFKSKRLKTGSTKYFYDEIILLVPATVELSKGVYYKVVGRLVNYVTPAMNIDIAVLVNEVDRYDMSDFIVGDLLPSKVGISGTVALIFTSDDNYKNFYHFTLRLNDGTTVRVVAWNSLADYLIDRLEEGDEIEVYGFMNAIPHKSRIELSREVLASLVLIKDDDSNDDSKAD